MKSRLVVIDPPLDSIPVNTRSNPNPANPHIALAIDRILLLQVITPKRRTMELPSRKLKKRVLQPRPKTWAAPCPSASVAKPRSGLVRGIPHPPPPKKEAV